MTKKEIKISAKEREIINVILTAEGVYDAVISQLGIDSKDAIYRDLVLGVLKRQTKDHLVFAIWNNLGSAQLAHLRDYIKRAQIIVPGMLLEDILMEFARLYPALLEKVQVSLSGFLKGFIAKFNEIVQA